MRGWKGGIRGMMERLDALEGKFNEKNDWKGWMYLFEGRFDDNLKSWDVLRRNVQ